ncbi:MAG TPA: FAD-dependent oxidoreductase, partial [Aldersonia sp.]
GAGPAGLEAALRLCTTHDVTLFDARGHIGGQLATAAQAPSRAGWSRLLRFYRENLGNTNVELGHEVTPRDLDDFGEVIIATGATETPSPDALPATALIADRNAISPGDRVIVVDDGFGSWLTVGAIESALAGGAEQVTVLVPGPTIAATIPPESRVQLMKRLTGRPVEFVVDATMTDVCRTDAGTVVTLRRLLSGRTSEIRCDRVVAVGERITSDWQPLKAQSGARVQVIGDAVVPRRVSHAIAEGYAAAELITTSASLQT